jgi:hypothetical protein
MYILHEQLNRPVAKFTDVAYMPVHWKSRKHINLLLKIHKPKQKPNSKLSSA